MVNFRRIGNSNLVIEPSADYGYFAGAIVNATVKSSTNQFHGDAFEFLCKDRLDAREFFLQPSSTKPILQRTTLRQRTVDHRFDSKAFGAAMPHNYSNAGRDI